MFALVDCNNFYASCERVFNPKLDQEPIIILSNNDGCVIARSNEAKNLGIKMGVPFFEVKDIVIKHSVFVFSSNYILYGDMSRRVMSTLRDIFHEIEEYSIDEAFINLTSFQNYSLKEFCLRAQEIIKRNTGIPVSIGIGKTKTLAKIANTYAKKTHAKVLELNDKNCDELLNDFPASEIWGIGKNLAKKIHSIGISTSLELKKLPPKIMRKLFTVTGQKIIYELRGFSCIPIEDFAPKKSILSSRSFSEGIKTKSELSEALSTYTARASEKLRSQKQECRSISIFIKSKHYFKNERFFNSITYNLAAPSNNSCLLIKEALQCLDQIYKNHITYNKVGIILHDLSPATNKVINKVASLKPQDRIMRVIDNINSLYGKKTIYSGSQGNNCTWPAKSEMKSRNYTKYEQLLEVK